MIPDEAVEAAAKVMLDKMYDDKTLKVDDEDRDIMRAALQAALPFIQAQTLRDAVAAFPLETITAPENAVVWLMRRADGLEGGA